MASKVAYFLVHSLCEKYLYLNHLQRDKEVLIKIHYIQLLWNKAISAEAVLKHLKEHCKCIFHKFLK